jgi:hypothetical protein
MYKYLVAVVLIAPLIGVWMVEGGEFAGSVGVQGFPNGATLPFAIYVAFVAAVAVLTARPWRRAAIVQVSVAKANRRFRRFSNNLMIFECIFLIIFLFGFGAINIWLGSSSKGDFRIGLGALGAFPNLMCKFVIPALVAYASLLYLQSTRTSAMKVRLGVIFVIAFITGASWGFKTTAISMVLPALLLLNWRVRPIALVGLTIIFIASLVVFSLLFDSGIVEAADLQGYLLRRITVLQGDVAWHVWGMYSNGEQFPDYSPTLLAALGDKFLVTLGLSREDHYQWMLFHYDWMLNYLAGISPDATAESGHSIIGTPFTEGLVAGGVAGLAGFSLLAGILTGGMYRLLDQSLRRGRNLAATLGATFCCYNLIPWLNAGAIVQLFHFSLLISLATTYVLLAVMLRFGVRSTPRQTPTPSATPDVAPI